jgi:hypothetical protein
MRRHHGGETDTGDGFRDRGFSKERREPQVAIGLLTDQAGFPLMVSAFEENMAETKTMLPGCRSSSARGFRTSPTWSLGGGRAVPAEGAFVTQAAACLGDVDGHGPALGGNAAIGGRAL